MSGSKQDTETVHAFFQDMRAYRLGDPIIVASVVRRIPSVQLRNACRARADRALPSRLEHAPRPRPIRRPLLQQNLGHPLTVRIYATGSIGFAFRQFAMVRPARCGYPLPQSAAP